MEYSQIFKTAFFRLSSLFSQMKGVRKKTEKHVNPTFQILSQLDLSAPNLA